MVCDSEPVAVEGLRALLEMRNGLRVGAEARSVGEAMHAISEQKPALAIFDKSLGFEEVLDCFRALRDAPGAPRTVAWGSSLSSSETVRLLRAGAAGVIRKTASLAVLTECFESVVSGGTWIEDGLIAGAEAVTMPCRTPLTTRELQVLDLVERGLTNKSIAAELGIRVGTVKIHLRHIFEKTGIRCRYGLALSGIRSRLTAEDGMAAISASTQ